MTIDKYTPVYRGKQVVDFSMGDKAASGDVVYRVRQDYDSKESQSDLLASLFSQVDKRKIDALIIGAWSVAHEESPKGYLDALIASRADLLALKALFVGDMTFEDCEISWIIQTSYNALLTAFPNLESLRVRGSTNLELKPFSHACLAELAIECGGLPSVVVEAIAGSDLPALKHLELWLGDDGYGFDGNIATYQRLLNAIKPQRLRYLGLRNSSIADELAIWLSTQPWLGSLETLDLSLGTIGDVGAQALFESPHLGGLQKIDLSHHYISEAWQEKLASLSCRVVLDDPCGKSPDDRYVAVSE